MLDLIISENDPPFFAPWVTSANQSWKNLKPCKGNYYPTVYIRSNCLFFAMSWVTELFHLSIYLTIDWPYTMAWLPASLLKTHRRLSTCATMMRVRFVYERRRATMVKKGMVWQLLNYNNSVVYGQKHKVWVLLFLVRTSKTFWDQIWADLMKFSVLQQNRIVYSNHSRNAAKYFIKRVV